MEIIPEWPQVTFLTILEIVREVFTFQASAERVRHGYVTGTSRVRGCFSFKSAKIESCHGYVTGTGTCIRLQSYWGSISEIFGPAGTRTRHGEQMIMARVRPLIWLWELSLPSWMWVSTGYWGAKQGLPWESRFSSCRSTWNECLDVWFTVAEITPCGTCTSMFDTRCCLCIPRLQVLRAASVVLTDYSWSQWASGRLLS